MNVIKKLSLLIFFITCTACGSNISGLDELKKLCTKDAGLTIHKVVEADGYYDSTRKGDALWRLISSDYSFIEFCNFDPEKPSFNETGCWQLTKVPRETGHCDEIVDKALMSNGSDLSREFRENNCITVEKLERPEAQYKYEVERKEWWIDERDEIKMSLGIGRIVDIKTGEVLGEAKNYVLRPKNSTPPSFHCGSAHVTGSQKTKPFAAGLIEKTLVTRSNSR